jgi:phosphoserine phosphatase RsbX
VTEFPRPGRAPFSAPKIEWGVAGRPLPGEKALGDVHVVETRPSGVLVAVLDGVGHGEAAADAAQRAAHVLRSNSQESLAALVRRCHQVLEGTRGAVMSLAEFHPGGAVSWLAVGNVEGVLLRTGAEVTPKPESLLMRGGVVGHRLPTIEASRLHVSPGDVLILASDGIGPAFLKDLKAHGPAQSVADRILASHARITDDGLVLVARYCG